MHKSYVLLAGAWLLFATHSLQAREMPLEECASSLTPIEVIDLGALSRAGAEKSRLPASKKNGTHLLMLPKEAHKADLVEEERQTQIEEDLATLRRIVLTLSGLSGINKMMVDGERQAPRKCIRYTQGFKRATVIVQTYDAQGVLLDKQTLIAGPAENFYLSADMPVTDIKQLTYDATTGTVLEKEKPASFYLGFNYKLGDVYTHYPAEKFYRNLSVKFLAKASSRPAESMGLGLAYRFRQFDIFAARIWTKDHASVGGETLGTTSSTVFGISFSITRALNWLKAEN